MYNIREVPYELLKDLQKSENIDMTVFQTYEWITFLKKNKNAEPVLLEISEEQKILAYFIGLTFKIFGIIKIMGSPFEGWATPEMGFIIISKDAKWNDLLLTVKNHIINNLHCKYMEIIDKKISIDNTECVYDDVIDWKTPILDINKTDEELFKIFKVDCRNFIRQFEKRGAVINKVEPSKEFAKKYYDQLLDVFAKQKLKPNYNLSKVEDIMVELKDSEDILCLEVTSTDGKCIATSIFFGRDKICYFWGAASYREDQHYRPNEYMIWTAIRYFREKGCTILDMMGCRQYKMKFGPIVKEYPRLVFTKSKLLLKLRNLAKKTIKFFRKIKGKFFVKRNNNE